MEETGAPPPDPRMQLRLSPMCPGTRAALPSIEPDDVVRYVANHPGCKAEEIAAAIQVETRAVSPVLKQLRDSGRVRAEGKARGMRYYG